MTKTYCIELNNIEDGVVAWLTGDEKPNVITQYQSMRRVFNTADEAFSFGNQFFGGENWDDWKVREA